MISLSLYIFFLGIINEFIKSVMTNHLHPHNILIFNSSSTPFQPNFHFGFWLKKKKKKKNLKDKKIKNPFQ